TPTVPLIAKLPKRLAPPPLATSTRSIVDRGIRLQLTSPLHGSFTGAPSSMTRARLPPTPRIEKAFNVGTTSVLLEPGRLNPGTSRRTSSSVWAGADLTTSLGITVTLIGTSATLRGPRVALTTTSSSTFGAPSAGAAAGSPAGGSAAATASKAQARAPAADIARHRMAGPSRMDFIEISSATARSIHGARVAGFRPRRGVVRGILARSAGHPTNSSSSEGGSGIGDPLAEDE